MGIRGHQRKSRRGCWLHHQAQTTQPSRPPRRSQNAPIPKILYTHPQNNKASRLEAAKCSLNLCTCSPTMHPPQKTQHSRTPFPPPWNLELTAYTGVAAFNIGFGAKTACPISHIFPHAAWKAELEGEDFRKLDVVLFNRGEFFHRTFFFFFSKKMHACISVCSRRRTLLHRC